MPSTNVRSRWSGGNLIFEDLSGNELARFDGVNGRLTDPKAVYQVRKRFTVAQVNAGAEILPALPGFKYRMVNCKAIAVGGAAGAVTTVDVTATQGASGVKLVAFAQASLARSAVLTAGGTGAAVLADGASYLANDGNTAVNIGKTGSNVTTATHIDVVFEYGLDAA